jgi:uncharacterized protein (DUF2062 family)
MTIRRIRTLFHEVLHLDEPPHRTALAFAVGLFIAFCPLYGLHTIGAGLCVWLFRLNAIAVLAGSFVNNPWTLVPILGATMWTGLQLTGSPDIPPLDWSNLSTSSLYAQVMPYAVPFFIGGTVLSCVFAALGYPAAYTMITRYRTSRTAPRAEQEQLPPAAGLR